MTELLKNIERQRKRNVGTKYYLFHREKSDVDKNMIKTACLFWFNEVLIR